MNHRELHERLVAVAARIRLQRVVFQHERDDALMHVAMLTAALEVLDSQELDVHESMRDLDDERLHSLED